MLDHFFLLEYTWPPGCGAVCWERTWTDLATILHQQGYAPSSIRSYLRTGETFGRWLHGHGYAVSAWMPRSFSAMLPGSSGIVPATSRKPPKALTISCGSSSGKG